jgi:uncharacterized membrane protein
LATRFQAVTNNLLERGIAIGRLFRMDANSNQDGGVMTNQKQGDVPPEGKQKVAQEVEVDTTASSDSENPEDPISEESEVPKTSDAPAD